MAERKRGAGPMSSIWVQKEPSHSQVSPKKLLAVDLPPNRTVRLRSLSKAMALPLRGLGPKFDCCVHRNFVMMIAPRGRSSAGPRGVCRGREPSHHYNGDRCAVREAVCSEDVTPHVSEYAAHSYQARFSAAYLVAPLHNNKSFEY